MAANQKFRLNLVCLTAITVTASLIIEKKDSCLKAQTPNSWACLLTSRLYDYCFFFLAGVWTWHFYMFYPLLKKCRKEEKIQQLKTAARLVSYTNPWFETMEFKKGSGTASSEDFRDKAVLLFFSAGWCPWCKQFTPYLKEFYENAKSEGLQVVWVSRDRSKDDQTEYYEKNLPADWPYIPFGSQAMLDVLKRYKIQTIPSLKLVASNGEVVDEAAHLKVKNSSGRSECREIVAEWRKKVELARH